MKIDSRSENVISRILLVRKRPRRQLAREMVTRGAFEVISPIQINFKNRVFTTKHLTLGLIPQIREEPEKSDK